MDRLIEYSLQVSPGLFLLAALYLLIGKRSLEFSLFIFVLGFILLRDAMTPAGFWEFGATDSFVPWIRFIEDSAILFVLGFSSLLMAAGVVLLNKQASKLVDWGKLNFVSVGLGLLGALVVVAPFLAIYQGVSIDERGGAVAASILPALLFISLSGNFLEEVLFRGYLQGFFEKKYGVRTAILLSGVMFSVGHIFLATTVTSIGLVIILFTLYEGLICAFVRSKQGVIASTVTHGVAIFVLASGL